MSIFIPLCSTVKSRRAGLHFILRCLMWESIFSRLTVGITGKGRIWRTKPPDAESAVVATLRVPKVWANARTFRREWTRCWPVFWESEKNNCLKHCLSIVVRIKPNNLPAIYCYSCFLETCFLKCCRRTQKAITFIWLNWIAFNNGRSF